MKCPKCGSEKITVVTFGNKCEICGFQWPGKLGKIDMVWSGIKWLSQGSRLDKIWWLSSLTALIDDPIFVILGLPQIVVLMVSGAALGVFVITFLGWIVYDISRYDIVKTVHQKKGLVIFAFKDIVIPIVVLYCIYNYVMILITYKK